MTHQHNDMVGVVSDARTMSWGEQRASGLHVVFEWGFVPDDDYSPDASSWTNGTFRITPEITASGEAAWFRIRITNVTGERRQFGDLVVRFLNRGAVCLQGTASWVVASCSSREHWLVATPLSGEYTVDHMGVINEGFVRLDRFIDPGQELTLAWRARWYDSLSETFGAFVPAWFPVSDIVEEGESIDVEFPDGVVSGRGVQVQDAFPVTRLLSSSGTRRVSFITDRGEARVGLGWARGLDDLVRSAHPSTDPGVDAWVLSWLAEASRPSDEDLDRLDIAVAAALEDPGVFAIGAAARSARLLGRSLLSDATAALDELVDDADDDYGVYLAALHLYARALAMGWSGADDVVARLFAPRPGRSLEGRLVCEQDRALANVRDVAELVNWGVPGAQFQVRADTIPLLRLAAESAPEGEWSALAVSLHARLEAWARASHTDADSLAWLLW